METLKVIGIIILAVLGLALVGVIGLFLFSCGYTANGCSSIFN